MSFINQVIQANCITGLNTLNSESVHLILSDIPYGIGVADWDVLHNNTNSAYRGSSPAQRQSGALFQQRGKPINGWSEADRHIAKEYYDWCKSWASEWLRILKPGASAFVFAGRRLAPRCTTALEDAGFCFKDMLSWIRQRAPHRAQRLSQIYHRRGNIEQAETWTGWKVGNLRPLFEPILWFTKPYKIGSTLADNILMHGVGGFNEAAFLQYESGSNNILTGRFESKESGFHPTQKPIALLQSLIELSTQKGQIVLDPFCGSGSTLLAAQRTERHWIGFENDPRYAQIARERLSHFSHI
jgi:site-specific DNA-methyltransferase (adenine-specific)